MPEVVRDDATLHYDIVGDGPAIVLIHCLLSHAHQWQGQVEPLVAAGWQVVTVDLRGHGNSGPITGRLTIYDLADDVIAVLDDADIATAVWCGSSWGGMVGLRGALRHPDRVRALVVAGSDAGPERVTVKLRYRAMSVIQRVFGVRPMLSSLDGLFFSRVTVQEQPALVSAVHDRWLANHRPSMTRAVGALVTRDDLLPQLHAVEAPTLVIVGADDTALPVDCSERLAAALPEPDGPVIIERAGHLSPLEQPEHFNAALLDFLGRLEARSDAPSVRSDPGVDATRPAVNGG